MADLKLKSEWVDKKTIRVSWNDLRRFDFDKKSGNTFGIIATLIFIFSIIGGLSKQDLSVGVFGLVVVIIMVFVFRMNRIKKQNIIIKKEYILFEGSKYQTSHISRVAIAKRSEITGNIPHSNQTDPMEIRIWFNDEYSIVVSENCWQNQINIQIRNNIDRSIQSVLKKSEDKPDASRPQPRNKKNTIETGGFGIPKY